MAPVICVLGLYNMYRVSPVLSLMPMYCTSGQKMNGRLHIYLSPTALKFAPFGLCQVEWLFLTALCCAVKVADLA